MVNNGKLCYSPCFIVIDGNLKRKHAQSRPGNGNAKLWESCFHFELAYTMANTKL